MRTLEITADGETYQVTIRQGLATIHDSQKKLVRVHRVDGGKPQPSPDDKLMAHLISAIKATDGGVEYLNACSSVRLAREMALADPGSKWRDYETAWIEAREVRESWEEGLTIGVPISRRRDELPSSQPPASSARLPRSSMRRRLVAWGQR